MLPPPMPRIPTPIRFLLVMAWRDSRTARPRLLLLGACIAVGISALVAVGSLRHTIETAVGQQARTLLGADLSIGSRVRFTPEHEAFLQSLGGEQAREITFTSMIVFPDHNATRLVQVRAVGGGFPFYGAFESSPPEAASGFRTHGGALVERSLLLQFSAKIGDRIRIGNLTTHIAGSLEKVPGETVAFATIAPRVFLRLPDLDATGLLQTGSLARYRALFRFPPGTDATEVVAKNKARLDDLRLAHATVETRKADLGEGLGNLDHFLSLVAFVALLLGGIGVASAIQSHVTHKIPTIAILRCLGAPMFSAFSIYLTQALALATVAAMLGAAAGAGLHHLLPGVIGDFLPLTLETRISWPAIAEATTVGFLVCTLFTLLPLAPIRHTPPLAALRWDFEPARRRPDALQLATLALLAALILGFGIAHSRRWQEGLGFAAGLFAAAAILALVARLAIATARRLRLEGQPFVVRQGLANLHRPSNRTPLLVTSLGLGTFLLLTLQLTQDLLLHQLVSGREANRPNAILFDIQPDQRDDVALLVLNQGLPVLDQAPIVTMRLKSVRGRPVEELLREEKSSPRNRPQIQRNDESARTRNDPGKERKRDPESGWLLRREFRCTFTDHLRDSEQVTAGTWTPRVAPDTQPVPISLETDVAKELGVGLGDEIVWDIQGIPSRTTVASLRKVDWRRVQPNFFVLFPSGPLDDAPATHVLVTRIESPEQSARLQRAVVERFPNVSAIDLTLVLQTLDQILGKVSSVVRFMALFTVATGLLVLVASVASGRWQRARESVLLRVLGASRRQVMQVLLVEYAALGVVAAATGVVLALASTAALAVWVFHVPFVASPWPALVALVAVTFLTTLTGILTSRGITTGSDPNS